MTNRYDRGPNMTSSTFLDNKFEDFRLSPRNMMNHLTVEQPLAEQLNETTSSKHSKSYRSNQRSKSKLSNGKTKNSKKELEVSPRRI